MSNTDVLIHHGVRGMKWGVRRYQNKDGTLTAEGREHYSKAEQKELKAQKKEERKEAVRQKREDVKDRRNMSDEELRKKIDRLKLEKELRTVTDEEVNRGRKFVADIMTDVGKRTLTTALTGASL